MSQIDGKKDRQRADRWTDRKALLERLEFQSLPNVVTTRLAKALGREEGPRKVKIIFSVYPTLSQPG